MSRIVVDPEELTRFAALAVEAADDHAARAARLRSMDVPALPPEVDAIARQEVSRIAATLDALATGLYAEALMLRSRAAIFDPALRRYVIGALSAQPG